MPPPAKPSSSGSLQRPLQDGHQSSPYFPRDLQASKKRDLECGNEVITPSIVPEQAVPAKKRRNLDTHEKSYGQSESKKPAKSSAKQVGVGEHKTLFQIESFQRIRRPSTDLDHEECKLHDRVSREEASIFRSAKIYGQSVEKRRRLGN